MKCKICASDIEQLFTKKLLSKYNVGYYKCISCDFIQTEDPYWLSEAYNDAITTLDIGLLSRNLHYKPIISNLINLLFKRKKRFLDFGGGYGVLVRLMRDAGYDFYRYDLYCENIFSKGFDLTESNKPDEKFELLTAFEVFEHLEHPLAEIEKMLEYSDSILFSTELVPAKEVNLQTWWYLAPETGQHISFYTKKTLEKIADMYGLNLYTNGYNLHLLTKKNINKTLFKVLSSRKFATISLFFYNTRTSLLQSDFDAFRNILNKQ